MPTDGFVASAATRAHVRTIVVGTVVVLAPNHAEDEGCLRPGAVGTVQSVEENRTGDVVAVVKAEDGSTHAYDRMALMVAKVKKDGQRSLHSAARSGDPGEVVWMVEDEGVDPNAPDSDGLTPLMHAAHTATPECVAALLQHGANLEAADGNGQTALFKAVIAGSGKNVAFLIRKGANPAAMDGSGLAPLHHAAKLGAYSCAQALVAGGAPLSNSVPPSQPTTPAALATASGFTALAEELYAGSDRLFHILRKYAQKEKRMSFTKSKEWAESQAQEFSERFQITTPDMTFYQLSAKIDGLKQSVDAELLRGFLLRFAGRQTAELDLDYREAAELAEQQMRKLEQGVSLLDCNSVDDLRESIQGITLDDLREVPGFIAALSEGDEASKSATLAALQDALVGEGLKPNVHPEMAGTERVLLRTDGWLYVSVADNEVVLLPHGTAIDQMTWKQTTFINNCVCYTSNYASGGVLTQNDSVNACAPIDKWVRMSSSGSSDAVPKANTLWVVHPNMPGILVSSYGWHARLSVVPPAQALLEKCQARRIQRCWHNFTRNEAYAAKRQLEHERIATTLAELDHLHSIGIVPETVLLDIRRACQTGRRAEDVEKRLHSLMHNHATRQRQQVVKNRKEQHESSVQACLADSEDVATWDPLLPTVKQLKWQLGWSDPEQMRRYAHFRAKLNTTIGLTPLRLLAQQVIADAIGRKAVNEPFHYRHILLSGLFGTGKRTAAEIIGALTAVVGATWIPPPPPGAVRSEDDSTIVQIDSFRDLRPPPAGNGMKKRTAYYIRGPKRPSDKEEGELLGRLVENQSYIICGGDDDELDYFEALDYMKMHDRKRRIRLPMLGVTKLAEITLQLVEAAGYRLRKSGTVTATDDEGAVAGLDLAVMEYIVRQTYDDRVIEERNAHLASDMLQRAISRKNERIEKLQMSAGRLILTPQDFGVEMATEEELKETRTGVEDLVATMWGASDSLQAKIASSAGLIASAPLAPAAFFKKTGLLMGKAAATDTSESGSTQWNVLVTGNKGTGKRSMTRLYARYLRAHGITTAETVVERHLSNLTAADDEVKMLLESKSGGCLYVTLPREVDAQRGAAQLEILDSVLETMGETSSVICVLAGDRVAAGKLLHSSAAIALRMHFHVDLLDYSPAQLVTIAKNYAREKQCSFEPGLGEKLAKHIKDIYEDMSSAGNGTLAKQLVDKANLRREDRVFGSIMGDAPAATDPRMLTADDFAIGATMVEMQLKDKIDAEIQDLVGLEDAKLWFEGMKKKVRYVDRTGDRTALKMCMNLVMTGNPGTGKTSFARLLYRFMRAYGVLKSDHEIFVERNGLELKGEFLGDTAPKVKRAIKESMGGCLFVDEAYSLAQGSQDPGGGGDAFAKDAIRTLLTEVENNRTSVMVILAGYKDKMAALMRMDPGLDRRFPQRLHLPDYSPLQIAQVCAIKARRMFDRTFENGLEERLAGHIRDFHARDIPQQNAGLAVNLTEGAVERQIDRLVTSGSSESSLQLDSRTLTAVDYGVSETPTLGDAEEKVKVLDAVDKMIGMANAKSFFRQITKSVSYVENGGSVKLLATSLNMIITGNPGTGKTTIARMISRYLHAFGVLPRDRFVEKNGLDLKGKYVGHTSHVVKEAIDDAMGGCLFIDEAYALMDGGDGFSCEAIRTLLTEVENNRSNLLVVMAGYEDRMITNEDSLMNADPGLARRFASRLHLDDYTPLELARISQEVAKGLDLTFQDGLMEQLAEHIGNVHAHDISKNNGGLSVNLTEKAFRCLAERAIDDGLSVDDQKVLIPRDFEIGVEQGSAKVDIAKVETPPEPNAVVEAVKKPDLEPVLSFSEVLVSLGVGHHAEALAAESIAAVGDLTMLTETNLVELGFKIGERNRVLRYIGGSVADQLNEMRAEVNGLKTKLSFVGGRSLSEEEEELAAADRLRRIKAGGSKAGGKTGNSSSGGSAPRAPSQNAAKVRVETKQVVKEEVKEMELVNPLFATAGPARKLAFAIDVSGSMLAMVRVSYFLCLSPVAPATP